MNNDLHIETLIARVLSGEATPSEIAEVEAWKNNAPENVQHFETLQKIFILSSKTQAPENFNADAAWVKVKNELGKNRGVKTIPINRTLSFQQIAMRIAAVVLIVAGLSYTIYKVILPEKVTPVTLAAGNEPQELMLPDSTRILLNRNSQLVYKYSSGKRIVQLKGEAFLELAADPDRPFELLAGSLNIIDIGTAFNVKAEENTDSVIVIVTDGELLLTSPEGKSVSLLKGEQAVYYNLRDEFIIEAITDTNALSYKTKVFVFENASLEIIARKLSEVYNEKVLLEGAISSCHLTATFKNETLDNILEIIATTLKLEVIKSDEGYILKGEFCEE